MFKLAGIFLAFAASSIIGFYKAYEMKRRRNLLLDFQNLMIHFSTEMGYFKEPLPLIFERIMDNNDNPANLLLRQCFLRYQQEQCPMEEIWKYAVDSVYEKEPLKTEDIQIINRYGSFLGQSDSLNQQKHFTYLQNQLEKQIREAEEDVKTKGALYSKAGVSVGAVIAIAFI